MVYKPTESNRTADNPPSGGSAARLEVSKVKTFEPPIVITIDGENINDVECIDVTINFKED